MSNISYILPLAKDNAEGQLDAAIAASSTSLAVKTGEGVLFPEATQGTTTSAGDSQTLNSTGIGSTSLAEGDFIENLTDGSHAFVISVSTNQVITTPLRGGGSNIWDNAQGWAFNRFLCTLNKRDVNGAITASERVLVTERNGDVFAEISRGFDGDTAQPFDADDYVSKFVNANDVDGAHTALGEVNIELKEGLDLKADLAYVNSLFNNRNWKQSCRVATAANVDISSDLEAGDSVDGVTLAEGDRVLVKEQTDKTQNGIYVVPASGAATRSSDFDASTEDEIPGSVVTVREGNTFEDTMFLCTNDSVTIGVTEIVFVQYGVTSTIATQQEAYDGIDNSKLITPLRAHDAIDAKQGTFIEFAENVDGTSTPQAVCRLGDGYIFANQSVYNLNAVNNTGGQPIGQDDPDTWAALEIPIDDYGQDTVELENRIYLPLGAVGTCTGEFELQTDNAGEPSGTVIATAASILFDVAGANHLKYLRIDFGGGTIDLTSYVGSSIWLVLKKDGSNDLSNHYVLSDNGTNQVLRYNGSGASWSNSGKQAEFIYHLRYNFGRKAAKYDPNNGLKSKFLGFTTENVTQGSDGLVRRRGANVDGFSSLEIGSPYYGSVNTAGEIDDSPNAPVSGGVAIQKLCVADDQDVVEVLDRSAHYATGPNVFDISSNDNSSSEKRHDIQVFVPCGFQPVVTQLSYYSKTEGAANDEAVRGWRFVLNGMGGGRNQLVNLADGAQFDGPTSSARSDGPTAADFSTSDTVPWARVIRVSPNGVWLQVYSPGLESYVDDCYVNADE